MEVAFRYDPYHSLVHLAQNGLGIVFGGAICALHLAHSIDNGNRT